MAKLYIRTTANYYAVKIESEINQLGPSRLTTFPITDFPETVWKGIITLNLDISEKVYDILLADYYKLNRTILRNKVAMILCHKNPESMNLDTDPDFLETL